MRLLLVEDDPYLQETLARSLSRRGMQVSCAASAAQALSLWKSVRPDVVVLDLTLPDGDGLNVVSQIRKEGLTTPVLVLTARTTVGDRVLGLNSGADDYMAKPFDLDELEARVNALYRRARSSPATLDQREGSATARADRQSLIQKRPTVYPLVSSVRRRPAHFARVRDPAPRRPGQPEHRPNP